MSTRKRLPKHAINGWPTSRRCRSVGTRARTVGETPAAHGAAHAQLPRRRRRSIPYGLRGDALIQHAVTVTVNELAAFAVLRAGGRRISSRILLRPLAESLPSRRKAVIATTVKVGHYGWQWVEMFDDEVYRVIEKTILGTLADSVDGMEALCCVKTSWVGVDQNCELDGAPLIFETEDCGYQEPSADRIQHFATEAEARR
jgi:hypothetical protein